MSVFSTNQNRQLYVVKGIAETLTPGVANAGKVKIVAPTAGEGNGTVYVQQINATGEPVRSDIIKKACILSAQASAPTDSESKLKKALVVLNPDVNGGKAITGEDYILRINLRQYFGMGDDTTYIKDVAVKVTSAMNATPLKFYQALATALEKSFSREIEVPFTFVADATGLTITEKEGPWYLGTMKEEPLQFDIFTSEVNTAADGDVVWGKVIMSGATKCTDGSDLPSGVTAPAAISRTTLNSHKIADLEYFCMGERGDQYRNVCWPKVIPTKYLVNSESTEGYSVLDIHYAYIGDGMENQASEKTMTFVGTKENLASIATAMGVDTLDCYTETAAYAAL